MTYRIQCIAVCAFFVLVAAQCCKLAKTETTQLNKTKHTSVTDSLCNIYDNDTNIVYWEMWNDTLHIYTKEDSARDELESIKYIHSIEPFPGEFDSLFNMELENNN